jgi:hypothetical protein
MLLHFDMNRASFEPRRSVYQGLNVCTNQKVVIVRILDRTYRTERLKTGAEDRKVEADSVCAEFFALPIATP